MEIKSHLWVKIFLQPYMYIKIVIITIKINNCLISEKNQMFHILQLSLNDIFVIQMR